MKSYNSKDMRQLILTIFILIIPIIGLGQNGYLAEYMCNKYNGKLNYSKTPVNIKVWFRDHIDSKLYTCIVKDTDNRSIYYRTNHIISKKRVEKTNDWSKYSIYGKDYKYVSFKVSNNNFALYVPVNKTNRLYILVSSLDYDYWIMDYALPDEEPYEY